MAKLTYEETKEALELKRTALKEANAEFKQWRKDNKIGDDAPKDAKLLAKYNGYKKTQKTLGDEVVALEASAKELKPAREGAFAKKYTYPAEITTAEEKKKYRAAQRRLAKGVKPKAEKAAKEEKGTEKEAPKKIIKKIVKKED